MIKSKFQWQTDTNRQSMDDVLVEQYKLTPLMRYILESKGYTEATQLAQVLSASKDNMHNPSLMSDMDKAVKRIHTAIQNQEKILVYGDYDADGVTSTTIMVKTLQQLGAIVGWYIPNRFTEGYGPSEPAFKNAYDEGVSLIITVDNGIQGHTEIEMVQNLGVDVIVTDHHEIGDTLPAAYAIVHPMHPDYDYPFISLCGAGVALKLAQSLLGDVPNIFWVYAMIGTIADLVSLTDENRFIVQHGLQLLNESPPVSIAAILNQAQFNDTVTEETIGFIIGPRLNAVGRLDDAALAAELLMTDDAEEALFLAEQVEHFNVERKDIVQTIVDEAMVMAEDAIQAGEHFLVLTKEDWHEGVLGIVASRIVETFHLPTMVLNIDHEQQHAKGSSRSITQVSMFEALSSQHTLISKFGGHHMAAGLTLPIDQVSALREGLNDWMRTHIDTTALQPIQKVDVTIDVGHITVEQIQSIERLRPFGTDFKRPIIQVNGLTVLQSKGIGQQQAHLKMTFVEQNLQALFWNQGALSSELMPNQHVDVTGELQINEWNGNRTAQMVLTDMKSNERQILDYRSKNKRLPVFEDDQHVCYLIHPNQDKTSAHEYYYGENIPQQYDKCVMRDLPLTMEDIKLSCHYLNTSHVYLVFQHDRSIYFEGLPQPADFKNCYKALYQKGQTDLQKDGVALSQFINVKPMMLKFILKVFLDLGIISQKNGIIEIVHSTDKQPITSSRVYQARVQRIEVEKQLLYEEFGAIKSWLENELARNE
ncbi:single-stranded-DNA-specific exonuclease RecJ [Staphylococcus pseudintermedius]|nr:single-stranded-DNA-specific exonuclease RecJ [Staphylococcus pseudintermedius]